MGIAAISNRRGNDEQMASRGRPYMDNVAIPLLQQQSLDNWHVPAYKEMRHHHRDVVHGGQPNTNDKHVERLTNVSGRVVVVLREGRDNVCTLYGGHKKLMEENISKRLMDNRQGMGCVPAAQQPMRSRTCNEIIYGHQTAVSLHQQEPLDSRHIQCLEESMNRSCIQCPGELKRGSEGTGDAKHSYTNMGPEKSR
jgi:hypothetical protein